MRKGNSSIWMFLIGLGSQTQFHLVGSLGISEFPMFLLAPIVFFRDYRRLKDDGFMPFIWIIFLVCLGCCISSLVNYTPFIFFLKAFAQVYALFAATVFIHRFLAEDYSSLKWILIGILLSNFVNIFIFQPEVYTAVGGEKASGEEAVDLMVSNVLFWSARIKALLYILPSAFYFSTPIVLSIIMPLIASGVVIMLSQSSGRAAAACAFMSAVLIMIGQKSRKKMASIGRHIWLFLFCGLLAALVFKQAYSYAAKNGYLGDKARDKYYLQTRTGSDFLHMLMAGRMELFCGVRACLHKPLLGFGPRAEDDGGYVEDYLFNYATQEDFERYVKDRIRAQNRGEYLYVRIPTHSYISMFWVYYGILGLVIWLYVLLLFFQYFKQYAPAIPEWYGYVCLSVPAATWDIFFSPFAARVTIPLLVSCILIAKLASRKRDRVPYRA